MTIKSTTICSTLCLLLLLNSVYAFNFKSLLFGETNQENVPSSTSATFGTLIPNNLRSSRSGMYNKMKM